jgi:hypothetical protein
MADVERRELKTELERARRGRGCHGDSPSPRGSSAGRFESDGVQERLELRAIGV